MRPSQFKMNVRLKPTNEIQVTLDHILPFGIHRNMTIRWVIENNPSYIKWLKENWEKTGWRVFLDEEANVAYKAALQSPDFKDQYPSDAWSWRVAKQS